MTAAKFYELFGDKIEWGKSKTSNRFKAYLIKYENLLRAEAEATK